MRSVIIRLLLLIWMWFYLHTKLSIAARNPELKVPSRYVLQWSLELSESKFMLKSPHARVVSRGFIVDSVWVKYSINDESWWCKLMMSSSWHVQVQVLAWPGPVPGMSRLSWLILVCPGLGPGMSRSRSWHVHAQILVCPGCPGWYWLVQVQFLACPGCPGWY